MRTGVPSGQILPRLCASEATVHLIYCAKYVSLRLVGDLAQDCSLCLVGLSTSELAIPQSAGEILGVQILGVHILGVHRWHLRNGLLPLRRQIMRLSIELQDQDMIGIRPSNCESRNGQATSACFCGSWTAPDQ